MDAVKAFNTELSSLYDVKPPISKAKMNSLTRGAIKAIKFYKHVVQSVEKFIQKCKPEYKVPGLYVIDSIVRQSRHQFGTEKDVFAPRFAKNMQTTFLNLLKCPPEDKSKVIRVLNLWQKNAVFPPEVIQPLFDLVDPNHPIHKEQSNGVVNASTGNNVNNVNAAAKTSSSPTAKNTPKDQKIFAAAKPIDPAWLAQTKMETANIVNANKLLHLQQLLLKKQEAANEASQSSVKFDKKLLDFDYGEEEDDDVQVTSTSPKISQAVINQHSAITTATSNLESLGLLLANPEVLRQLQTLQQTMQNNSNTKQQEMEEKMRKLQQMKQQEEEFDKHLAQTVPTLPFAAECELKPADIIKPAPPPPPPPPPPPVPYAPVMMQPPMMMTQDMSQPPPGYHPPAMPFVSQPPSMLRPPLIPTVIMQHQSPRVDENNLPRRENSVEIVNCDPSRSQSRSPDRFNRRHSRSRSPRHRGGRDRDRSRDRKSRSISRSRSSRSRSRSRSRRHRSRSRDRSDRKRDDNRDQLTEEERERERERRKKGLPPIVKEKLSVCSTTLWVGHLSKLVHQEELSDTFGELGDIVSIDLISPRGCAFICMNRRQDAYRALTKLKNHKMQGKAITLAWAPGKGVKGKEWKDYWEVELGVSYIPWNKLNNITDHELELLEEGGMIDEESMPPRLKARRKCTSDSESSQSTSNQGSAIPTVTDGIVQPPPTSSATSMVDTSQPPPLRPPGPQAALLPPPNQQLMMPGFTMPPGMLGPMGLSMPPGLMPNVPIGVPPPNMQGLIGPPGMMQTMMQPPVNTPFAGLLAQIPMPAPAAPSDKPNSTGMPHNVPPMGVPPPTSESGMPSLPMMRQAFGVPPMALQQMPPQPPNQQQQQRQQQPQPPLPHQQHSDDMDVEMEDVMSIPPSQGSSNKDMSNNNKPQSLSDQLLASMKNERDGDRDFRERERDRDRRDRDRDRDGGGGGLGDRDRNDRRDDRRDSRGRDRGRGGERGGRDRNRRNSRDNRDRDDRRNDRDRDRDMRHSPMRQRQDIMGNDPMGSKKDMGPKPSLADRLRQLADGTLPLIDERMDRDMRGSRNERGSSSTSDRHDRGPSYDESLVRRPPLDVPPPPQQPPSLLGAGRRPGEGPPSLLDLPPQKFPGPPSDRPDFSAPRDFGSRNEARDLREFSQRMGDRDSRAPFSLRAGGPMGRGGPGPLDDFTEPPRSLMDRRFGPLDEFEARLAGGPRPDSLDFDMRHGPLPAGPPPAGPRDPDFEAAAGGAGAVGRSEGRPGPPGRLDDFDRQARFDFDMRQRKPGDVPPVLFDPRDMPDDFDLRDHPDFDLRGGRRDYYMDSKFGHPGMMGPRGPRGPMLPGMMGPDGYGPRGRGPPMFHPRGMGPRGMRPGMRPPFGPGGPRGGGPPGFDPRDGPDGAFFRGGPGFEDAPRGGGGGVPPMGRPGMPPFGIGPPGSHPPPLLGNMPGDGPWRNEGGPLLPLPPHPLGRVDEPEEAKDNKKRAASSDRDRDRDRENRRRENRKSRWGNASPSEQGDGPQFQQMQQDGSVSARTGESSNPADGVSTEPWNNTNNAAGEENWDDESSTTAQKASTTSAEPMDLEQQDEFNTPRKSDAFYDGGSQQHQTTNEENYPPSQKQHEPPSQERFELPSQERYEPPPQERFEPPPPLPQENFETLPQESFEATPKQSLDPPPQKSFEPPSQDHFEPPPQERFEQPPQEHFEPAPQKRFEPPREEELFDPPPQERYEPPPQERFEPPPPPPPQEPLPPPQDNFEPPVPQEHFERPPESQHCEPLQEQSAPQEALVHEDSGAASADPSQQVETTAES